MKNDIQSDWLKISKICRDLAWLNYGDDYKNIPELSQALELLKIAKDKIAKAIEGDT